MLPFGWPDAFVRPEDKKALAKRFAVLALVLILVLPLQSPSVTVSATQTLSAVISPKGKVSVTPAISMINSGTAFTSYSGSLPVQFYIRTSAGAAGTITVQATSDFSPAGGPLVTNGNLTYTCSGATLGTACSGTQTVSRTLQTPVLNVSSAGGTCTGGGGSCSAAAPNSVSINLSLPNDPTLSTGTYSAQLTFTISAM